MKQVKTTLTPNAAGSPGSPVTPPPAQATASSGAASLASPQAEYDGIPFDTIVRAWLAARGVEGDVAEGARNTTLYQLSRDLRYLMDFNVERMVATLPRWGLTEAEARTAIQSAVSTMRGTEIPQAVKALIDQCRRAAEGEPVAAEDKNPLPADLPPLLTTIRKMHPRFPKAAVLASLPALGTLLTHLRARYADGEVQSPIFFTVIQAPQASGKSFARRLSDWLTEPIRENDHLERRREQEYKEKMKKAKNAKEQPDDPMAIVRCLPATTSNAVLLKRADLAAGRALYTFAEEIDTIARGNKAGAWSQKNDIYRMAFDGAEWGQDLCCSPWGSKESDMTECLN